MRRRTGSIIRLAAALLVLKLLGETTAYIGFTSRNRCLFVNKAFLKTSQSPVPRYRYRSLLRLQATKNKGDTTKTVSPSPPSEETSAEQEPCNVVFTHTNADFDSLAAAVALALLWKTKKPDYPTHVVLPRGVHPVVQRFLAFHKHLLPLRGFKTILPEDVRAIGVVDAQSVERIGRGKAWLENAQSIHIYDHHEGDLSDNSNNNNVTSIAAAATPSKKTLLELATEATIDTVGSTTTLLVELLKEAGITPAPHEATLFVLGIRADTGGLVYEGTTIRDAAALLWCLENGASQVAISDFGVAKIGDTQRAVLHAALGKTETRMVKGLRISSVLVNFDDQYVAGLAQVCEEIMDLTDSDVFVLGATHRSSGNKNKSRKKKGGPKKKKNESDNSSSGNKKSSPSPSAATNAPTTQWVSLIGRASARAVGVNLNAIMRQFGGGGHPKAAAAAFRCKAQQEATENDLQVSVEDLTVLANEGNLSPNGALSMALSIVENQVPEQLVASSFMLPVSEVVTLDADHTIAEARQIFDKYSLKSAPVVDSNNRFRSSLKLNDLVKASRAGRSKDKLKGMMRASVRTVQPDTSLAEIEHLLIHEGVGRIPVVDDDGILVGLLSRTDVLRQHKLYGENESDDLSFLKKGKR